MGRVPQYNPRLLRPNTLDHSCYPVTQITNRRLLLRIRQISVGVKRLKGLGYRHLFRQYEDLDIVQNGSHMHQAT